ncbi:uncharacterized protein LOC129892789 [Solanum dulcamara]|uniref:uncharacterized protein LOC129892789 n=1 Tax=Solanum dulcamara TaxID=45834 RepID=UPI002484FE2C|nr:uncharacterized protein LOC129892789 [Solanum dulcamara]
MDETGLFYRLEADIHLLPSSLKVAKKTKRELLLLSVAIVMDLTKKQCSEPQVGESDEGIQEVDELDEGVQELNDVIFNLAYRNVMDVEHLLSYPNENDIVMESPTKEEIIQSVMNNNDENDPEQDDSSIVSHVLSKETFQAMTTLSNYLVQHEQNILQIVFALLKVKDEINFGFGGR